MIRTYSTSHTRSTYTNALGMDTIQTDRQTDTNTKTHVHTHTYILTSWKKNSHALAFGWHIPGLKRKETKGTIPGSSIGPLSQIYYCTLSIHAYVRMYFALYYHYSIQHYMKANLRYLLLISL